MSLMRYLIQNGLIYDGTLERPPFRGDILVEGERITAIDSRISCEDAQVFDAGGRMVTPGFIDFHRHADLAVFSPEFGALELAQGITTVGMGVCGFSFAPYTEKSDGLYSYTLSTHGPDCTGARYTSMEDYLNALRGLSLPVNVSTLQGLGAIRLAVKGYDPSPFTAQELRLAQHYVESALACGLRGFSTGLVYLPELYNSQQEIISMLAPCRGKGSLFMPHMRDEASRLPRAVDESIAIARDSGMALGISHFKALGPDNWHGTLEQAIARIEQARSLGMDVTVDFYPYHGTATTLASILPASFLTEDFSVLLSKIDSAQSIERLRQCFLHPGPQDERIDPAFRWSHAMISGVSLPENRCYLGKTIHECAISAGYEDEYPFIARLLASENGSVSMVGLNISPDDIARIARLPYSMLISDSLYNITDTPHPRLYASFPHFLQQFALEHSVLSMQEAIHKMTQLPAQRMQYTDRGVLRPGFFADILVFDPHQLGDHATFTRGKQRSTGMDLVLVNGQPAWQEESMLCRAGVCLN